MGTSKNPLDDLPPDLANEWIRFAETKPSVAEMSDWCQLKAAEHGWNVLDLMEVLMLGVHKPELPEPEESPPDVN